MKFCPTCERFMAPIAGATKIEFVCEVCGTRVPGAATDTLWFESKSVGAADKSTVLTERASFDLAAKHVPIDCGKCHMRFMTLVKIDGNTSYHCGHCGNTRSTKSAQPGERH